MEKVSYETTLARKLLEAQREAREAQARTDSEIHVLRKEKMVLAARLTETKTDLARLKAEWGLVTPIAVRRAPTEQELRDRMQRAANALSLLSGLDQEAGDTMRILSRELVYEVESSQREIKSAKEPNNAYVDRETLEHQIEEARESLHARAQLIIDLTNEVSRMKEKYTKEMSQQNMRIDRYQRERTKLRSALKDVEKQNLKYRETVRKLESSSRTGDLQGEVKRQFEQELRSMRAKHQKEVLELKARIADLEKKLKQFASLTSEKDRAAFMAGLRRDMESRARKDAANMSLPEISVDNADSPVERSRSGTPFDSLMDSGASRHGGDTPHRIVETTLDTETCDSVSDGGETSLCEGNVQSGASTDSESEAELTEPHEKESSRLDGLLALMEEKVFPPGESIIKIGEEGSTDMYFITQGTCKVEQPGVEPWTVSKPDYFGEIAMFDAQPVRTASVTAVDEVKVKVLTKALVQQHIVEYEAEVENFKAHGRELKRRDKTRSTSMTLSDSEKASPTADGGPPPLKKEGSQTGVDAEGHHSMFARIGSRLPFFKKNEGEEAGDAAASNGASPTAADPSIPQVPVDDFEGLSAPPDPPAAPVWMIARSEDWRIEEKCAPHPSTITPPPTPESITLMRVIADVLWYKEFFFGKSPLEFLGQDPKNAPISVSIVCEAHPSGEVYRAIVRTRERVWMNITTREKVGKKPSNKKLLAELAPTVAGFISNEKKPIKNPALEKELLSMEAKDQATHYKFGILLCKEGQTVEEDMFNNKEGSADWEEFCEFMAPLIELKGHKGYNAQLDVNTNETGIHSRYCHWRNFEVMFQVSTLLPFYEHDHQQLQRKRHIGNDVVMIVFVDGKNTIYDPTTMASHFTHLVIVISKDYEETERLGRTRYRYDSATKRDVYAFTPPIPTPPVFDKDDYFREFIFARLVNGERAALAGAMTFRYKAVRTRELQLKSIVQTYGKGK